MYEKKKKGKRRVRGQVYVYRKGVDGVRGKEAKNSKLAGHRMHVGGDRLDIMGGAWRVHRSVVE